MCISLFSSSKLPNNNQTILPSPPENSYCTRVKNQQRAKIADFSIVIIPYTMSRWNFENPELSRYHIYTKKKTLKFKIKHTSIHKLYTYYIYQLVIRFL